MIPSTVTQLLVTLVLVVPGFVYHGVLIRIRGRTPGDTDLSSRILRSIVASTVFGLAYLAIAGDRIVAAGRSQDKAVENVRGYALAGLAAAFVIPAVSAWLAHLLRSTGRWQATAEKLRPSNWARIDPRPAAWDVAFVDVGPCFVRVRTQDGTWYAGWYGPNSYASSWPDPRSLFVEHSFHVDAEGMIGDPVVGSTGAVIDCEAAELVELLEGPPGTQA